MILWKIFKTLNNNCVGLDSGATKVYNIKKKRNSMTRRQGAWKEK